MKLKKQLPKAGVLWLTGLSGSGKTTITKILYNHLRKKYNKIKLLDGDVLRSREKIYHSKNSFTKSNRIKIGKLYSRICKKFVNKGYFVIIAVMALYKEVHGYNRKTIKNYIEIFLDVPIKELIKRDPKKIYKKFFQKKISNVTGLDLKYDKPKKSNITIKWKNNVLKENIVKKILIYLMRERKI